MTRVIHPATTADEIEACFCPWCGQLGRVFEETDTLIGLECLNPACPGDSDTETQG